MCYLPRFRFAGPVGLSSSILLGRLSLLCTFAPSLSIWSSVMTFCMLPEFSNRFWTSLLIPLVDGAADCCFEIPKRPVINAHMNLLEEFSPQRYTNLSQPLMITFLCLCNIPLSIWDRFMPRSSSVTWSKLLQQAFQQHSCWSNQDRIVTNRQHKPDTHDKLVELWNKKGLEFCCYFSSQMQQGHWLFGVFLTCMNSASWFQWHWWLAWCLKIYFNSTHFGSCTCETRRPASLLHHQDSNKFDFWVQYIKKIPQCHL